MVLYLEYSLSCGISFHFRWSPYCITVQLLSTRNTLGQNAERTNRLQLKRMHPTEENDELEIQHKFIMYGSNADWNEFLILINETSPLPWQEQSEKSEATEWGYRCAATFPNDGPQRPYGEERKTRMKLEIVCCRNELPKYRLPDPESNYLFYGKTGQLVSNRRELFPDHLNQEHICGCHFVTNPSFTQIGNIQKEVENEEIVSCTMDLDPVNRSIPFRIAVGGNKFAVAEEVNSIYEKDSRHTLLVLEKPAFGNESTLMNRGFVNLMPNNEAFSSIFWKAPADGLVNVYIESIKNLGANATRYTVSIEF